MSEESEMQAMLQPESKTVIPVPFVPAPEQHEIKACVAFGLALREQICSSGPGD
jgi:hypothetical protein